MNQVEINLEKLVEPVLKDGQQLFEDLQEMKMSLMKINSKTTQCKEFKATLKKVEAIIQNMNLPLYKTSLKIKQDISNIQAECSKTNGTLYDKMQCEQQHSSTIIKDMQGMQPIIINNIKQIGSLAKTINEEFQQCLDSQSITNAKSLANP